MKIDLNKFVEDFILKSKNFSKFSKLGEDLNDDNEEISNQKALKIMFRIIIEGSKLFHLEFPNEKISENKFIKNIFDFLAGRKFTKLEFKQNKDKFFNKLSELNAKKLKLTLMLNLNNYTNFQVYKSLKLKNILKFMLNEKIFSNENLILKSNQIENIIENLTDNGRKIIYEMMENIIFGGELKSPTKKVLKQDDKKEEIIENLKEKLSICKQKLQNS